MPKGTTWLSLAGLLLTACTSCSSSGGGSPGSGSDGGSTSSRGDSGPSISPTQACQAYAHAACTEISTCAPFTLAATYGDEPTCEQRAVLACTPLFTAGGSGATATGVSACATAVLGETCEQFFDNNQPSACSFTGTLAQGAACGSDAQCQSGFCHHPLASFCGTCGTRAGAGQGGPDGGAGCLTDVDCQATLLCGAGTCVAPGTAGAPCSAQQPCEHTLACVAGKCATPVPVGGACTALTDCDGANGAICNLMKMSCIAIGKAMSGEPCDVVSGGWTECVAGGVCDNVAKNGQGACHPPAADNALCGPDIPCLAPAICSSSARCTLPDPTSCQ
jgi:hypothetical protein